MFDLFSPVHILLILLVIPVYITGIHLKQRKHYLFYISVILFILEIIKQLYYLYQHNWTVWIVPFQLCSVPLYYWLLYKHPYIRDCIENFIGNYILIGGLFALIFPADMIKTNILLTIHSFSWHYLLILMSGICIDRTDIKKSNLTFFICLFIATVLNISLGNYGEINMFYISPLYPTTQPVFSLIQNIHIKNVCYIGCLMILANIISLTKKWYKKSTRSS